MKTRKLYLILYFIISAKSVPGDVTHPLHSAVSENPVLLKILQSVDAANSDERLFEATLKLLKSICICMNETLKAKHLSLEGDKLIDNGKNSKWRNFELYKNIYNHTCFNLRYELAKKLNGNLSIDEENAKWNAFKCGEHFAMTTENVILSTTMSPDVVVQNKKTHLNNILFKTLIETKDNHKYVMRRSNLFGKLIPYVSDASRYTVIIIFTLHPEQKILKDTVLQPDDKEVYNTINTNSVVDIDIIDTKYNPREKRKRNDVSDCMLKSLYTFLAESEKMNLTKVFKIMRRKGTIKVYIEVVIKKYETDYIHMCCNDDTNDIISCAEKFAGTTSTVAPPYKPFEESKINLDHYKETLSQIRDLVKMYGKKIQETITQNTSVPGLKLNDSSHINVECFGPTDNESIHAANDTNSVTKSKCSGNILLDSEKTKNKKEQPLLSLEERAKLNSDLSSKKEETTTVTSEDINENFSKQEFASKATKTNDEDNIYKPSTTVNIEEFSISYETSEPTKIDPLSVSYDKAEITTETHTYKTVENTNYEDLKQKDYASNNTVSLLPAHDAFDVTENTEAAKSTNKFFISTEKSETSNDKKEKDINFYSGDKQEIFSQSFDDPSNVSTITTEILSTNTNLNQDDYVPYNLDVENNTISLLPTNDIFDFTENTEATNKFFTATEKPEITDDMKEKKGYSHSDDKPDTFLHSLDDTTDISTITTEILSTNPNLDQDDIVPNILSLENNTTSLLPTYDAFDFTENTETTNSTIKIFTSTEKFEITNDKEENEGYSSSGDKPETYIQSLDDTTDVSTITTEILSTSNNLNQDHYAANKFNFENNTTSLSPIHYTFDFSENTKDIDITDQLFRSTVKSDITDDEKEKKTMFYTVDNPETVLQNLDDTTDAFPITTEILTTTLTQNISENKATPNFTEPNTEIENNINKENTEVEQTSSSENQSESNRSLEYKVFYDVDEESRKQTTLSDDTISNSKEAQINGSYIFTTIKIDDSSDFVQNVDIILEHSMNSQMIEKTSTTSPIEYPNADFNFSSSTENTLMSAIETQDSEGSITIDNVIDTNAEVQNTSKISALIENIDISTIEIQDDFVHTINTPTVTEISLENIKTTTVQNKVTDDDKIKDSTQTVVYTPATTKIFDTSSLAETDVPIEIDLDEIQASIAKTTYGDHFHDRTQYVTIEDNTETTTNPEGNKTLTTTEANIGDKYFNKNNQTTEDMNIKFDLSFFVDTASASNIEVHIENTTYRDHLHDTTHYVTSENNTITTINPEEIETMTTTQTNLGDGYNIKNNQITTDVKKAKKIDLNYFANTIDVDKMQANIENATHNDHVHDTTQYLTSEDNTETTTNPEELETLTTTQPNLGDKYYDKHNEITTYMTITDKFDSNSFANTEKSIEIDVNKMQVNTDKTTYGDHVPDLTQYVTGEDNSETTPNPEEIEALIATNTNLGGKYFNKNDQITTEMTFTDKFDSSSFANTEKPIEIDENETQVNIEKTTIGNQVYDTTQYATSEGNTEITTNPEENESVITEKANLVHKYNTQNYEMTTEMEITNLFDSSSHVDTEKPIETDVDKIQANIEKTTYRDHINDTTQYVTSEENTVTNTNAEENESISTEKANVVHKYNTKYDEMTTELKITNLFDSSSLADTEKPMEIDLDEIQANIEKTTYRDHIHETTQYVTSEENTKISTTPEENATLITTQANLGDKYLTKNIQITTGIKIADKFDLSSFANTGIPMENANEMKVNIEKTTYKDNIQDTTQYVTSEDNTETTTNPKEYETVIRTQAYLVDKYNTENDEMTTELAMRASSSKFDNSKEQNNDESSSTSRSVLFETSLLPSPIKSIDKTAEQDEKLFKENLNTDRNITKVNSSTNNKLFTGMPSIETENPSTATELIYTDNSFNTASHYFDSMFLNVSDSVSTDSPIKLTATDDFLEPDHHLMLLEDIETFRNQTEKTIENIDEVVTDKFKLKIMDDNYVTSNSPTAKETTDKTVQSTQMQTKTQTFLSTEKTNFNRTSENMHYNEKYGKLAAYLDQKEKSTEPPTIIVTNKTTTSHITNFDQAITTDNVDSTSISSSKVSKFPQYFVNVKSEPIIQITKGKSLLKNMIGKNQEKKRKENQFKGFDVRNKKPKITNIVLKSKTKSTESKTISDSKIYYIPVPSNAVLNSITVTSSKGTDAFYRNKNKLENDKKLPFTQITNVKNKEIEPNMNFSNYKNFLKTNQSIIVNSIRNKTVTKDLVLKYNVLNTPQTRIEPDYFEKLMERKPASLNKIDDVVKKISEDLSKKLYKNTTKLNTDHKYDTDSSIPEVDNTETRNTAKDKIFRIDFEISDENYFRSNASTKFKEKLETTTAKEVTKSEHFNEAIKIDAIKNTHFDLLRETSVTKKEETESPKKPNSEIQRILIRDSAESLDSRRKMENNLNTHKNIIAESLKNSKNSYLTLETKSAQFESIEKTTPSLLQPSHKEVSSKKNKQIWPYGHKNKLTQTFSKISPKKPSVISPDDMFKLLPTEPTTTKVTYPGTIPMVQMYKDIRDAYRINPEIDELGKVNFIMVDTLGNPITDIPEPTTTKQIMYEDEQKYKDVETFTMATKQTHKFNEEIPDDIVNTRKIHRHHSTTERLLNSYTDDEEMNVDEAMPENKFNNWKYDDVVTKRSFDYKDYPKKNKEIDIVQKEGAALHDIFDTVTKKYNEDYSKNVDPEDQNKEKLKLHDNLDLVTKRYFVSLKEDNKKDFEEDILETKIMTSNDKYDSVTRYIQSYKNDKQKNFDREVFENPSTLEDNFDLVTKSYVNKYLYEKNKIFDKDMKAEKIYTISQGEFESVTNNYIKSNTNHTNKFYDEESDGRVNPEKSYENESHKHFTREGLFTKLVENVDRVTKRYFESITNDDVTQKYHNEGTKIELPEKVFGALKSNLGEATNRYFKSSHEEQPKIFRDNMDRTTISQDHIDPTTKQHFGNYFDEKFKLVTKKELNYEISPHTTFSTTTPFKAKEKKHKMRIESSDDNKNQINTSTVRPGKYSVTKRSKSVVYNTYEPTGEEDLELQLDIENHKKTTPPHGKGKKGKQRTTTKSGYVESTTIRKPTFSTLKQPLFYKDAFKPSSKNKSDITNKLLSKDIKKVSKPGTQQKIKKSKVNENQRVTAFTLPDNINVKVHNLLHLLQNKALFFRKTTRTSNDIFSTDFVNIEINTESIIMKKLREKNIVPIFDGDWIKKFQNKNNNLKSKVNEKKLSSSLDHKGILMKVVENNFVTPVNKPIKSQTGIHKKTKNIRVIQTPMIKNTTDCIHLRSIVYKTVQELNAELRAANCTEEIVIYHPDSTTDRPSTQKEFFFSFKTMPSSKTNTNNIGKRYDSSKNIFFVNTNRFPPNKERTSLNMRKNMMINNTKFNNNQKTFREPHKTIGSVIKTNLYPLQKIVSPSGQRNMMRNIMINKDKNREIMTMNTNDFFSQKRFSSLGKPNTVLKAYNAKPQPPLKQVILRPHLAGLHSAPLLNPNHYFQKPQPMLMKPEDFLNSRVSHKPFRTPWKRKSNVLPNDSFKMSLFNEQKYNDNNEPLYLPIEQESKLFDDKLNSMKGYLSSGKSATPTPKPTKYLDKYFVGSAFDISKDAEMVEAVDNGASNGLYRKKFDLVVTPVQEVTTTAKAKKASLAPVSYVPIYHRGKKIDWGTVAISSTPRPTPLILEDPVFAWSEEYDFTNDLTFITTAKPPKIKPTYQLKPTRRPNAMLFFSPTVTDWWLDDMYLKVRLPLPVNSNPGMVFPKRQFAKMEEVADLGALFIDDLLDYKEMLDRGELPLERATSREKGQPLCMEQFYKLLGVCRIPEVGKDRLELPTFNDDVEKEELVVVACRNHLYPIPVKAADRGRLTAGELQAQLLHVLVDAGGAPPAPRVGLLTALPRDQWARAREVLIRDENNRTNLELISRALCILCLDEAGGDRSDCDDDTNGMLRAMHGGGTQHHSANRWFDKTVQLIISSDGTVGMCYEHSAAEGGAVIRLAERALARAEVADRPAPPPTLLPAPQAMKWHIEPEVERTISVAAKTLDRAISELDFKVYTYKGYGREFMKSCRTSPDVYIQLAMQYAYYKMYGHLVSTYESASLRRFRSGRVDNIRSAHSAAKAWAAAMCTAETPPLNDADDGGKKVSFNLYGEQKKLELFEEAARKQTSIMEANILGRGIDNHLLGLREAARETLGELPSMFTDDTYKKMIEYKLSTSQVATTTDGTFMGYGAVCPDGYGCSYNPKKDHIIFCISSFTPSSVTNTEAFRLSLEEALDSMKLMFQHKQDK